MRTTIRVVALAVIGTLPGACATQSIVTPETTDSSKVATISASSKFNFLPSMAVWIEDVDGVKVSASTSRVTVAPGHHTLTVSCNSLETAAAHRHKLEIDAEAGAKYQLYIKIDQTAYPCTAAVEKKS